MAHEPSHGGGPRSVDSVKIDEAFLDIPDAENEAIIDARKTYLIVAVSTFVWAAVVFIFIL